MQAPQPISTDELSQEVYKTAIATAEANAAVVLLVSLGLAVGALTKRREAPEKA